MDQLLDQKQAAHLLRLSVRTLERHRISGTGPRFVRLGRLVRYRDVDLAEWVRSRVHLSTSEPGAELIYDQGVVRSSTIHGAFGFAETPPTVTADNVGTAKATRTNRPEDPSPHSETSSRARPTGLTE
jgi:predicted DNA-binding transcriptional regulator AlpA